MSFFSRYLSIQGKKLVRLVELGWRGVTGLGVFSPFAVRVVGHRLGVIQDDAFAL